MERPCKLEVRGRVTLSFCSFLCSREVNGTRVEVGFIDAQNQLNAIKLNDTRPQADAYQLVMINGSVWVIGLDPSGYAAHRVCAASAG